MRFTPLVLFCLLLLGEQSIAQSRLEYVDLLRTQRQSQVYYEHSFFASSDSLTEFVVNFRIENDFLNFIKNNDETYSADIKANIEIFDKNTDQVVRTAFWSGNKTVSSFEQTSVRNDFLEGFIKTELSQGDYYYQLKFQGANQRRESSSQKTSITIGKTNNVWFYLLQSDKKVENNLINYGGNAIFGKDFVLSISLVNSNYDSLNIVLNQIEISKTDTSIVKEVFEKPIPKSDFENGKGWSSTGNYSSELSLTDKPIDISTYLLSIPNSNYTNSKYQIVVKNGTQILSKHIYQSYWYDMPLSLLNLDVSISMLEIIIPKPQLAKLFKGNESQRLKQFNAFWKEKDPSPDTEFNELMFEFYTRIDQAFKDFSTPRYPGFDTDMGKVFIIYGPPVKKERSFPSNGQVIETWTYPKKTFSFQASSGFGDFQMIK